MALLFFFRQRVSSSTRRRRRRKLKNLKTNFLNLSLPKNSQLKNKKRKAAGFDTHLKVLEKEIASIKAATEGKREREREKGRERKSVSFYLPWSLFFTSTSSLALSL